MIRFDQVTKTYRGTQRPALNEVSLEILKGEFVFLVGASGSGKSSFLRLVLKEEKPTRGRIHVLGQTLNTLASRKVPYFRRNLGVVFQDFRLLPQKTVFDNVAFTLQVIGKSRGFIQEAVPDVLKLVGLAGKEQRFPHELSGGEQQRVAIARAIVNKPAILLADEPTGNLDPTTSAGIMALLAAINANGTTVLMATHDSGIVDEMQRRVIELVGGQIVRDERGGGYQTQAIPIQELEHEIEEAVEHEQNPVYPEPVRLVPDLPSPPVTRPEGPRTGTRPAGSPFERPVTRPLPTHPDSRPAAGADPARTEPAPRTAAAALADAVSRATSALPIQRAADGDDRPALREPEEDR
jgi:cell division transport system ATP-binding protein